MSCVKSDRIYDGAPNAIEFDPVMSAMAKSIVTGTQYPGTVPFGVYASYSSNPAGEWPSGSTQSYFENTEFVFKSDNKYGGSPSVYWPLSGSLVFAGYSPYYPDSGSVSATFDAATKTLSITNFVSDGRTDLMYFLPTLSLSGNYVGVLDKKNAVPVQFRHALSLISFEIKADPLDDGRVKLETVTLKNANEKGDFSATCASSSSAGTLTWKNQTKISDSGYAVASSSLPKVLSSSSALTTQDLFVPGSNLADSPVVEFIYDITYNTIDGSGTVVTVTKEDITSSFTIKDYTTEWGAGKKYVYGVTIGLNRIEFEKLTADWN